MPVSASPAALRRAAASWRAAARGRARPMPPRRPGLARSPSKKNSKSKKKAKRRKKMRRRRRRIEEGEHDEAEVEEICDEEEQPGKDHRSARRPRCPLRSANARASISAAQQAQAHGLHDHEPVSATVKSARQSARLDRSVATSAKAGVARASYESLESDPAPRQIGRPNPNPPAPRTTAPIPDARKSESARRHEAVLFRKSRMKSSMSPSRTRCASPTSWPVRWSLTRWSGWRK